MIERRFSTNIKSDVPIVDIEIANDISHSHCWNYEASDITTLGVLWKNEAIIIQREKSDSIEEFRAQIRTAMDKLPNPYAFNINMEEKGIFGFTGKHYAFQEIQPWRGKKWNKGAFFNEVIRLIGKAGDEINCPFGGDSYQCIPAYANGRYEDIILHNLTCLLKEAYILKHGNSLKEKFKDYIDRNGWFRSSLK
ncbi:MAG TPA: hypothetical protein HA362_01655 [Nanoarchaeota archaeon]|nr:hypothetical protein [Nanoarchaeota archaeon]